jgi:hypothetical protein
MKTTAVLGTVALTELAAHFLSLSWALMFLLAAFAWTALSGASVAAKARSTEDRVNNLVPVIGAASTLAANAFPRTGGTVSGSVTVTGAHTVNGQVNAGTLSVAGAATTGGNHTVHGSMNADSNVSAGGQVSGSNFSGGSIHVSGSGQADGNFTAGGQVSGSSFSGNSIHVSGNAQADGTLTVSGQRIAPGQGTPAGYPASGSPSTAGLGSYSNAIVNGLIAAGIF